MMCQQCGQRPWFKFARSWVLQPGDPEIKMCRGCSSVADAEAVRLAKYEVKQKKISDALVEASGGAE